MKKLALLFLLNLPFAFLQAQEIKNTKIGNSFIYARIIKGNTIFAGTYGSGLFSSDNNGETWTTVRTYPDSAAMVLALKDNIIFAGTYKNGIYISKDDGLSWTKVNNGLIDLRITALAVKDENIFAGTEAKGVFLSGDNGSSWKQVSKGLSVTSDKFDAISHLLTTGPNIIAGTREHGIFVSTDNGSSWKQSGDMNEVRSLGNFAVSKNSIVLTTGTGMVSSLDQGATWNKVKFDQDEFSFFYIGENIFLEVPYSSAAGIYVLSKNGKSFGRVQGIPAETFMTLLLKDGPAYYTVVDEYVKSNVYMSADEGRSWDKIKADKNEFTASNKEIQGELAALTIKNEAYKKEKALVEESLKQATYKQQYGGPRYVKESSYQSAEQKKEYQQRDRTATEEKYAPSGSDRYGKELPK